MKMRFPQEIYFVFFVKTEDEFRIKLKSKQVP